MTNDVCDGGTWLKMLKKKLICIIIVWRYLVMSDMKKYLKIIQLTWARYDVGKNVAGWACVWTKINCKKVTFVLRLINFILLVAVKLLILV